MAKKKDNAPILKKKIKYLEEELVRKQKRLDELKKENLVLIKTALKSSEEKIDNKVKNKKKEEE